MKASWPTVKLGEVLRRSTETVTPEPDQEYSEITVRLWGNGVVQRGRVMGASVNGRRFIARRGQFIASRIDARNGAMGLVPESLDGALVTNDFPLFAVASVRMHPEYLGWLSKTQGFVELCAKGSEGTTNRVRLKEDKFLGVEIPLPPIAEQRRIVARIQELVAQIAEAQALREQAAVDLEAMLVSLAHRTDLTDEAKRAAGWQIMPLHDCMTLVDDSHRVSVDRSYPNLGIYSYARGLFHKQPIEGMNTSAPALRRVRAGQFIYSRLFAFEGAYGMVTQEYEGHFVSGEYPTFKCNPDRANVEFLEAYFKAPSVWREVAVGSKGLGNRRQRVQPAQILSHRAWVPPLAWQALIAQTRTRLDELKCLHDETAAELDALMPAILDRAFKGEL